MMFLFFLLGAPSICVEYHRRFNAALTSSLDDPLIRQWYSLNLITERIANLADPSHTFLIIREGPKLYIRRQFKYFMWTHPLLSIHFSKALEAWKNAPWPVPWKSLKLFPSANSLLYPLYSHHFHHPTSHEPELIGHFNLTSRTGLTLSQRPDWNETLWSNAWRKNTGDWQPLLNNLSQKTSPPAKFTSFWGIEIQNQCPCCLPQNQQCTH